MSLITNFILHLSDEEFWPEDDSGEMLESCPGLDAVNSWLEKNHHSRFVSLVEPTFDDSAGYGLNVFVYGCGVNHLPVEDLWDLIVKQDWKDLDNLQLFYKVEGDERFSVLEFE
ncbi:MAG: hypothetical protein R3C03_23375 [Pirellulaceae bacterium]